MRKYERLLQDPNSFPQEHEQLLTGGRAGGSTTSVRDEQKKNHQVCIISHLAKSTTSHHLLLWVPAKEARSSTNYKQRGALHDGRFSSRMALSMFRSQVSCERLVMRALRHFRGFEGQGGGGRSLISRGASHIPHPTHKKQFCSTLFL